MKKRNGRRLTGFKSPRKNPARLLSDKQLGELAGDLAIQTMFGLVGTALASCDPKIKEAMLRILPKAGIEVAPGIVVASTDADERTSHPDPQTASIQQKGSV